MLELALKGAERGWISDPTSLTPEVMATLPLTPKFSHSEFHGPNATPKIRLIDDFKASGANDLLSSVGTCVPPGLDEFLSLVTYMGPIGPNVELRALPGDFSRAYKTVGIPVSQSRIATIAIAPHTGNPHVETLRTQPFGSARAPENWGRVANFIQFVMGRLLSAKVALYIDDVFAAEPLPTVESAYGPFTFFCSLLGCEPSPGKIQRPTKSLHLLWAEISSYPTTSVRAFQLGAWETYCAISDKS